MTSYDNELDLISERMNLAEDWIKIFKEQLTNRVDNIESNIRDLNYRLSALEQSYDALNQTCKYLYDNVTEILDRLEM